MTSLTSDASPSPDGGSTLPNPPQSTISSPSPILQSAGFVRDPSHIKKSVRISAEPPTIRRKSYAEPESRCGDVARYIIVFQSVLYLAALLGNVVCWNAAIVKLTDIRSSPLYEDYIHGEKVDWNDDDLDESDKRLQMSQYKFCAVFAVSFFAALITIIPMTLGVRKYGGHKLMVAAGIASTAATGFTPWACENSFEVLLVLRFFIGVAQCAAFPAIDMIVHTWAPSHEKGIFVAVLAGYNHICAILTTAISSWIAEKYGWPVIFYAHAGFSFFCLCLWLLNYRDDPRMHPLVGVKERRKIGVRWSLPGDESPIPDAGEATGKITTLTILTSPVVMTHCLCIMAYCFILQLNIAYLLSFLVWIKGVYLTTAGLLTIIPLVCQFFLQFATGFLTDRIKCVPDLTKMRFCNSLSFFGCAVGLFIATFLTSVPKLSVGITLFSMSLLGFTAGGYPKSIMLVSHQAPSAVKAVFQASMMTALFLGSLLVPLLTPNRSFQEYNVVFRIYSVVLVVANVLYLIFSNDKPHYFARDSTTIDSSMHV